MGRSGRWAVVRVFEGQVMRFPLHATYPRLFPNTSTSVPRKSKAIRRAPNCTTIKLPHNHHHHHHHHHRFIAGQQRAYILPEPSRRQLHAAVRASFGTDLFPSRTNRARNATSSVLLTNAPHTNIVVNVDKNVKKKCVSLLGLPENLRTNVVQPRPADNCCC